MQQKSLEPLRGKIDAIDRQVLSLLSKRMLLSKKIAFLKLKKGLGLKQSEREFQMLALRNQFSEEFGLSKEFVERLFGAIIEESIRLQAKHKE